MPLKHDSIKSKTKKTLTTKEKPKARQNKLIPLYLVSSTIYESIQLNVQGCYLLNTPKCSSKHGTRVRMQ